jgi:hypothetical protein
MMIPEIKIPTFDTIIPVSNRKVKFRPFLVKEEKLLILSSESGETTDIMNAVHDVVSACTFGEVDVLRDPLFETQFMFLQIRGKSIGEMVDFNLVCGECGHELPAQVHINDFTIRETEGHTTQIELAPNYIVQMRYPTFAHFKVLYETTDLDIVSRVVGECIESIITDEEVIPAGSSDEMFAFVEQLVPAQLEKLEAFFHTMPMLEHTIQYQCVKCDTPNEVRIDGIHHFFG